MLVRASTAGRPSAGHATSGREVREPASVREGDDPRRRGARRTVDVHARVSVSQQRGETLSSLVVNHSQHWQIKYTSRVPGFARVP